MRYKIQQLLSFLSPNSRELLQNLEPNKNRSWDRSPMRELPLRTVKRWDQATWFDVEGSKYSTANMGRGAGVGSRRTAWFNGPSWSLDVLWWAFLLRLPSSTTMGPAPWPAFRNHTKIFELGLGSIGSCGDKVADFRGRKDRYHMLFLFSNGRPRPVFIGGRDRRWIPALIGRD